tara:strand:+ start:337 stop:576 length:240 start_codon:yes stop_codon:yes gene_type:complete
MSIITRIDGIPLFSTAQKAMDWGMQYGLTEVHTHVFQGQTGYMAGSTHNQAVTSVNGGSVPQNVQTAYTPPTGGSSGGY